MKLLQNNLTFAIVGGPRSWRFDLTERFCQYYSYIINDDFLSSIIYVDSVDAALESCKTDYLIVQKPGSIICDFSVFENLDSYAQTNPSIFFGYVRDFEDYAIIDSKFIFINHKLWNFSERPRYFDSSRSSFFFTREIERESKKPFILKMQKKDDNKLLIPSSCSEKGGSLIAKQLELYSSVIPIQQLVAENSIFYLDDSSPYNEIISETYFEKVILPKYKNVVHFIDATPFEIKSKVISPTTIFSPARGLRAVTLSDTFKPEKMIVYDSNPISLELQRRIFSIDVPRTYLEVLNEFANEFPSVSVPKSLGHYAHSVVPKTECKVSFALIDSTSFEIEKMITHAAASGTVLFDFGDSFVQPYNFYKRPLYQVQALFSELFSFMKSRPGPSHVFGFAPGFEQIDDLDINAIRKVKRETDEGIEVYDTPFQFIPKNSIPHGSENVPVFEPLVKEPKNKQKSVINAALKKATSVPLIGKILEKKITPLKQEPAKPSVVKAPPKPEISKVVETKRIDLLPHEYEDLQKMIIDLNYVIRKTEDKNTICCEKTAELNTFSVIYEYIFNKVDSSWVFNCSKVGGSKKTTFSSGNGIDGLYRHMALPTKFNKHAAEKFL